MERLNAEFKKTIVMVTHDPKAASRAHRLVHLDKGVLKEDVHAERGKAVGMAAAISASVDLRPGDPHEVLPVRLQEPLPQEDALAPHGRVDRPARSSSSASWGRSSGRSSSDPTGGKGMFRLIVRHKVSLTNWVLESVHAEDRAASRA